jgi:hypothetical protein
MLKPVSGASFQRSPQLSEFAWSRFLGMRTNETNWPNYCESQEILLTLLFATQPVVHPAALATSDPIGNTWTDGVQRPALTPSVDYLKNYTSRGHGKQSKQVPTYLSDGSWTEFLRTAGFHCVRASMYNKCRLVSPEQAATQGTVPDSECLATPTRAIVCRSCSR